MKTVPLIKSRDGIYRIKEMRVEIEDLMRPKVVAPPRFMLALKTVGYCSATVLVGFGALLGMIVIVGFAACFWAIEKMRRAWR